jgi:hypothetical protein
MKLQGADAFCMMDNKAKIHANIQRAHNVMLYICVFPTLFTADSKICGATVQEENHSFLSWDRLVHVIFISVPNC